MYIKFLLWNTKENRPATHEEIEQLTREENLYFNWHVPVHNYKIANHEKGIVYVGLDHNDYEIREV